MPAIREPADEAAAHPLGGVRQRPLGRLDDSRCSVQALARGDSGVATASPAQRWLLVEQPGPWGRDALSDSRFDAEVAHRLASRAREENVRVLLLRRPDEQPPDRELRWAYADGRSGREGLWWSTRSADADLLDVPWDGSVGDRAPGPVYLVCTQGAHDACCALRGRPLARALRAQGPDVWECSHVGGDRFAANVVVLPYGFYYGQVPGNGAELVAAHAAGQVALPWLRGRAGLPLPAQAAQHSARAELSLLGVDELPVLRVEALTPAGQEVERWAVTLAGPDGEVAVVIEGRPSEQAALLTCRAAHPAHSRTWHLLSLTAGRRGTGSGLTHSSGQSSARPRARSRGTDSSAGVSEPW